MVLLIAALLLVLPVTAQATVYYVATTGSNTNNGTSESTPFLTIAHCANVLVAGDTCLVRGGTYTESGGIRIKASGTASAPIKLMAYPNERPVITFPAQINNNRILVEHATNSTTPTAMGYITVEGFEISGGWEGIKFTNMHNSTLRRNTIHDGFASGIFGGGGHHNVIEKNIIYRHGNWVGCANGTQTCSQQHGIYAHGDSYIVRNNLIYDNIGGGIQQNGSGTSLFSPTRHPSTAFAGAQNWIIESNTFAYEANATGVIHWGNNSNTRNENNIYYENRVNGSGSQAIFFTGNGGTGVTIRNNHSYGSGSGGTVFIGTNGGATEGVNYTQSGNVVNVSPPAFVNAGSNALPTSPDFRLTASAPVNIALSNEYVNNTTNVVGAYKTVAAPSCSLTANVITCIFPMNTATPIRNLSTAGVTIGCTGANCPGGGLTASGVARVVSTDSHVEITVAGFAGNACVAANQNVTITYNSVTGSWTGNDNIGAYPGLSQKIFSFTGLPVTNNCTGSGPVGTPGTPTHLYLLDDAAGTVAANTGSVGAAGNGTVDGAWGTGKNGTGVALTAGASQEVSVPYGNGVNPTTQSLTIGLGVFIPVGSTGNTMFVLGPSLGTNQRAYVCAYLGTWRISLQTVGCQSTAASNLAVQAGWNFLTLVFDSTTDTATLSNNAVTGTGGATGAYTSFTFASDFMLGRIPENTAFGGTIDYFVLYTSVQSSSTLYAAFQQSPTTPVGTLAQDAIQFQSVVLDIAGAPIIVGPSVQEIEVPAGGGAVILFQVHCQNVADCDPTAFKFVYAKNGSSTWQQVPDVETADGTWMWGATTEAHLNNGARSTRLTGSCTVTTGSTQVTTSQVPAVDLPQDGCVVLGYIPRVGSTQAGNYFDYKLRTEADVDFSAYTQTARMRVVNPMASGVGF